MERHIPLNVLRNQSVFNIRLAMMKCRPSVNCLYQATDVQTPVSPLCAAACAAAYCRPLATFGRRTASTTASAYTPAFAPSGMSADTANSSEVAGPDTKFWMTCSPASMSELPRGSSDFGRMLGTTARIAPSYTVSKIP